jgi:hypothetical protein
VSCVDRVDVIPLRERETGERIVRRDFELFYTVLRSQLQIRCHVQACSNRHDRGYRAVISCRRLEKSSREEQFFPGLPRWFNKPVQGDFEDGVVKHWAILIKRSKKSFGAISCWGMRALASALPREGRVYAVPVLTAVSVALLWTALLSTTPSRWAAFSRTAEGSTNSSP